MRDDAGPPDAPLLEVEGLTLCYGRRVACHDIAFTLWPGEVLAIVGGGCPGRC